VTVASEAGYREAAASLTPPAVAQFLAAHDWELEARQDRIKEIWRSPEADGRRAERIMLPLATDYVDYPQRFADTLTALGHIHDWDAAELLERIAATRADLFHVRLDQPMTDGTIPFQQAEGTLQALLKLLKAAATSAAAPGHPHRGRRPAAVSDFLEDGVRLGHTKRGSFVFTVVTRLGEPVAVAAESRQPAFPRRVMETLAQGLETTQRLASAWDETLLARTWFSRSPCGRWICPSSGLWRNPSREWGSHRSGWIATPKRDCLECASVWYAERNRRAGKRWWASSRRSPGRIRCRVRPAKSRQW
jgi:hypothetical protein